MRRARATRPPQPNSANTQFPIKTYGKPAALFSVNRLSDAEAQSQGSRAFVSSAERWSGNPEPTNMRRPRRTGSPPKPVSMQNLRYGHDLNLWPGPSNG